MIKKLFKEVVVKIAQEVVQEVEDAFGGGRGEEKKAVAIRFVIDRLPLPVFVKPFASKILGTLVDEAVEFAVAKLS